MDRISDGNAKHWEVLGVLGKDHWARLQDQDAMAMRFVNGEEMLGKRRAEGAATDDDNVEGASVGAKTLIRAALGFVEAITDVAAQDIAAEVGSLGKRSRSHRLLLPRNDGVRRAQIC